VGGLPNIDLCTERHGHEVMQTGKAGSFFLDQSNPVMRRSIVVY
jgi:hypothetical protein